MPHPDLCQLHADWNLAAGPRITRDITGPATGLVSCSLTLSSPVIGAGAPSRNT